MAGRQRPESQAHLVGPGRAIRSLPLIGGEPRAIGKPRAIGGTGIVGKLGAAHPGTAGRTPSRHRRRAHPGTAGRTSCRHRRRANRGQPTSVLTALVSWESAFFASAKYMLVFGSTYSSLSMPA